MHPRVLSDQAWTLVRRLVKDDVLAGWTLAGGTGLALQFGHRVSEDLDFFRHEPFEPDQLTTVLAEYGTVSVQSRSVKTLHCFVNGIRLSFLGSEGPLLFPGTEYRGLIVADPRDIAVTKIVAIGGRGSRKDFVDLYVYLERTAGIEALFRLVHERFGEIDFNEYHLLKSLTYFDDAEAEPMPRMLAETSWPEVKTFFCGAVKRPGA